MVLFTIWSSFGRSISVRRSTNICKYLSPKPLESYVNRHKMDAKEIMELKGRIVVYTIMGCPYCMKAKYTLQQNQLPYSDVILDHFPQYRQYVRERTGRTSVPQIFFNSIYVGGNDDLQKKVQNREEFEKLIDEVKNNPPPEDAPIVPEPSTATVGADVGFHCEVDELALLVRSLRKSDIFKTHRSGLTWNKNSFSGKDLVDWIVKEKVKQLDRSSAVDIGQKFIDQHFVYSVTGGDVFKDNTTIYKLVGEEDSSALNAGIESDCIPRSVNELGEEIRKLILKLYAVFLSADGKMVDYTGIGGSVEFENYKRLTGELVRAQVKSASRDEKLAFFINVYNALVIHATIDRGPPTTVWQRYRFFNTVRYIIGGHPYSLQEIENGVLRGNRKGVGMIFKPFGASDERLQVALSTPEPLIHFALVCGARSCPQIKTYSAQDVMNQLLLATQAFLEGNDAIHIDLEKQQVSLSMIFKWYREDFGTCNEELLRFVYEHMSEGLKKDHLTALLSGQHYQVVYMKYDWALNSH